MGYTPFHLQSLSLEESKIFSFGKGLSALSYEHGPFFICGKSLENILPVINLQQKYSTTAYVNT